MAELSPVLQPHRDGGSRLGYTAFPGSEGESEAELSLSLARTKIRSYGSTASVTTPWAERYIEHRVSPSDTLQGIALKYGVTLIYQCDPHYNNLLTSDRLLSYVRSPLSCRYPEGAAVPRCVVFIWRRYSRDSNLCLLTFSQSEPIISDLLKMEQIKRANKLFSTDCIFLRKSLNIPVISDKTSLFNGLNLLDSPETESQEDSNMQGEDSVSAPAKISSPSSSPETNRPIVTQDEELSAKDFLHRLDLQIKRSTQAAKRLKEEEYLRHEEEEYYSTSSYQH